LNVYDKGEGAEDPCTGNSFLPDQTHPTIFNKDEKMGRFTNRPYSNKKTRLRINGREKQGAIS
jgi:hypothetical protein